ncbi:TIGR01440 family protein [Paenalkalicoccus suaedae]|uniref:UPF0340 protein FLK61_39805 n=1 Tax=Paenalkalicoccus suaedae TaxID=2592382 RepID=A0A859FIN7_9BACI|nr:TIGR01440 family protein [Paenalkalicoccus suaedae]QKS72760.1 TIGR01440 family protein [Paenalkalicoccus suaedae]
MATEWTGSLAPQLAKALDELQEQAQLKKGQILVIGASTSEVIGKHIGKAGSMDVATELYKALDEFRNKHDIYLAFQCCEHLNRAILIERDCLEHYRLEDVSVIPVPSAGGSMASFAHKQMTDPVLVEDIQAHAGIDIGDTFIGMHLKKVAVPVRTSIKSIGDAHVTFARTRPKLIGGARAQY